ncbi:MAG: hypothetical protein WBO10_07230 [Pyrinomonadaceae bacterium]
MDLDLSNQVVVSPAETAKHLPRRTLDLSNIQTQELKMLAPLGSEIAPTGQSRANALLSYSERLRNSYRTNEGGLRDGMLLLGETLKKGQSIAVSCTCKSGEMCHADVVKMAIEKVHNRLQIREAAERQPVHSVSARDHFGPNPRTQRAINEILSVTKSDLLLSRIDNTGGRSQNEHSSFLNQHSQFTRDLYERGATTRAGVVIVPKERLSVPPTLNLTTNKYAVKKLEHILQDRVKAVELAPKLVEYGTQIAGSTADRETQVKVFNWIYRSLEGKSEFLDAPEQILKDGSQQARFDRTIKDIANLAQEMSQLEPSDHLESLEEKSRNDNSMLTNAEHDHQDYEEHDSSVNNVLGSEIEMALPIQPEFERIEVGNIALAQMASKMDTRELNHWFEVRLPAIDRELESGKSIAEILDGYLDKIYLASVHEPSSKQAAIDDLRFASAYIDHQIKHPESKLRHFNLRYREFAGILDKASSRDEVIEAASHIRSENARIGREWDNLPTVEKMKTPRPLTSTEMQYLFTEGSPGHYNYEMTIARLAFSHAGHSRVMRTDALMRGEIKPGREAQKLVESLESRLERRYLNDSLGATKHFLQSLKTPNDELRNQNDFDHKALYLKLSPPEKDFIYQRAIVQKEALEAKQQANGQLTTRSNLSLDSISDKSPNTLNTLRGGIVSDLLKTLESHPEIDQAVLTEQTKLIVSDRFVRAEQAGPLNKGTIDKLGHELAGRIALIRNYRSEQGAITKDTATQKHSENSWKNHQVSEKPLILSR